MRNFESRSSACPTDVADTVVFNSSHVGVIIVVGVVDVDDIWSEVAVAAAVLAILVDDDDDNDDGDDNNNRDDDDVDAEEGEEEKAWLVLQLLRP